MGARRLKNLPECFKSSVKLIQNRRQNAPKSTSGGGWAGLVGLQGVLGSPLAIFGVPWARFRVSGVRLGAAWSRLGAVFGPSWGVSIAVLAAYRCVVGRLRASRRFFRRSGVWFPHKNGNIPSLMLFRTGVSTVFFRFIL